MCYVSNFVYCIVLTLEAFHAIHTLLRIIAVIVLCICKTGIDTQMSNSYGVYVKHGSHDIVFYSREIFHRNYCFPALYWLCPQ